MKDYSIDSKDHFILSYKIKDNNIIIDFANESGKVVVPYTKENEKKILEKMKNQVCSTNKILGKIKSRENKRLIGLLLILGTALLSGGFLNNIYLENIYWFISTFAAVGFSVSLLKDELIKNDIKKNKYFLENEKNLNDNVKKNQNMLFNTRKVTKDVVLASKEDDPALTINTVDKIPFSDLKQIINNIERENMFDFCYSEEIKEEKSKVRKRN